MTREDREKVLARLSVSRETIERLDLYVAELQRWQAIKNLVGPGTIGHIWSRHVLDSAQLCFHAREQDKVWLDLGSGAGLPGLVIAILQMERQKDFHIHLIESNGRKCAFLRHVARVCQLPVQVHCSRLEDSVPKLADQIDLITARALAPLSQLLDWCKPLWRSGAQALFLKGRDIASELTEAAKSWRIEYELFPSLTDPEARLLRIRGAEPWEPGPSSL